MSEHENTNKTVELLFRLLGLERSTPCGRYLIAFRIAFSM
jgi:hypothetical protein